MSSSDPALPGSDDAPQDDSVRPRSRRVRRKKTFAERWRLMSLPNQLMFLATLVIALATVVNVIVFTAESISGSSQTDKLVAYAKTQAQAATDISDAADDFTDSAHWMEEHMHDAATAMQDSVEKAQKSIEASNRQSKAALDASIVASRSDQRAYVTIGKPDGTVADIVWPKDDKGNAGVLVYFQNNGRLPAKFNWGADSPSIALTPLDPTIVAYDKWKDGSSADLPTDHMFQPMYRAKNLKGQNVQWSGTIDIAGGSAYQGLLWETPKERMLQLINFENSLMLHPRGIFEYCDGFGKRVCRRFNLRYAKEPYNRFFLVMEDECSAIDMQVLHPMPDYEYLPVCSTSDRPELQTTIPSLPKPQ
jgi:hypothetical protein